MGETRVLGMGEGELAEADAPGLLSGETLFAGALGRLSTRGLGDPAAQPAMRRSLRALAAQDRPKIQRLIDGLAEAAPGQPSAKLIDTVERLEAKIKALEDRLAALEPQAP